jgi:hypothetical protein
LRKLVALAGFAFFLSGCAPQGTAGGNAFCQLPEKTPYSVESYETSIPTKYELSRDGWGRIQVKLFLEFIDREAAGGYLPLSSAMRTRTERCLQEANPYLLGPNGERLAFVLASAEETRSSALRQLVQVTAQAVRGESTLWVSSWGCPQIFHEVLHKGGGLVDEYAEPHYDFSCRSLGPEDSMMVDPVRAYEAVLGQGRRRSLLYPAQFNAIAYPGCQLNNAAYLSHARNAYRSRTKGCAPVKTVSGALPSDWVNL